MSSDDTDEKIALLNEIRDEVRRWSGDINRGIDGLSGAIDRGLDGVDRRLDRIDGQFDRINGQFDRINGQFDRIDAALADCAESVRLTVHYVKVLCKQRGIEFDPA